MGGRVERDWAVSFLRLLHNGAKRFSKLQFILTFWFHKIFSHEVVTLLKKIKKTCEIIVLEIQLQLQKDLGPIVEQ